MFFVNVSASECLDCRTTYILRQIFIRWLSEHGAFVLYVSCVFIDCVRTQLRVDYLWIRRHFHGLLRSRHSIMMHKLWGQLFIEHCGWRVSLKTFERPICRAFQYTFGDACHFKIAQKTNYLDRLKGFNELQFSLDSHRFWHFSSEFQNSLVVLGRYLL